MFFSKYYKSIDTLPVIVYDQITDTGDIKKLCYKGRPQLKKCLHHWYNINNELYHSFGLNPAYRHLLELKQEYAQFLYEWKVGNDLSAEPMAKYTARIIEKEQESLGVKENLSKVCAKLSKAYGFMVDPAKVTVRMFFAMMTE